MVATLVGPGDVRHIHSRGRGQVDLVFLFVDQDLADLLGLGLAEVQPGGR